MELGLGRLNQIALTATDMDAAVKFYGETMGLRLTMRAHPGMAFFDLGGMSLLLETSREPHPIGGSVLYFDCDDIALTAGELGKRGVTFIHPIHLVTAQPTYDFYMTFFRDPTGNMLALSMKAPKGYKP